MSYYIFEADELYTEERRLDAERFIVNRALVASGYGKFDDFYGLYEHQLSKPCYAKPDLLKVAEHCCMMKKSELS